MKNKLHILLSALLSVSMVFTLFSVAAFAQYDGNDLNTVEYSQGPTNKKATKEAVNLYNYLTNISYSDSFVVGAFDQFVSKENPNGENYDLISRQSGISPGLYSARYEFQPNTNTYSYKLANTSAYNHYKNGAIILMHPDTEFLDALYAVAQQEGIKTKEDLVIQFDKTNSSRNMVVSDEFWKYITQWADALEDLESRGVKAYMFRMFIEMNASWLFYYYGKTDEGYAAFKNVWIQVREYFFNERHLNGCLLTWSPSAIFTSHMQWPGDEYVDVISTTLYSEDKTGKLEPTDFKDYEWFSRLGKPIGLSELGVRTGSSTLAGEYPPGDWYECLKTLRTYYGNVGWVNTFSGCYGLREYVEGDNTSGNYNAKLFLNSPYSKTLKDIPDFSSQKISLKGRVRLYNGKDFSGQSYPLIKDEYRYSELKDIGITSKNIQSLGIGKDYNIICYTEDDFQGESYQYISSKSDISKDSLLKKAKSLKIVAAENIGLEKEVLVSSNSDESWKANDGTAARWVDTDSDHAWLVVNLGGNYKINRWIVDHAGMCNESHTYNTSDFRIEKSLNGVDYEPVDSVKSNVLSKTDRLTGDFTARYVRLYVTKPNSSKLESEKKRTSISEFSLYGAKTDEIVNEELNKEPTDDNIEMEENEEETSSETYTKVKKEVRIKKPGSHGNESVVSIPLIIGLSVGGLVVAAGLFVTIILYKRRKKQKISE